ncbi:MAG: cyclohexanecarboxyl-CoA dehydrogenase [Acidimicrobiia bacterium]|nr:cyclohexanecarboxyl-CoA dehydrogenase [Acidimicrobiia bacterium]
MHCPFVPAELEDFRDTLRDYAARRLLADYPRWKTEPYPRERVVELGDLGVLGLCTPGEYGGSAGAGGGYLALGVAAEEIARGDFNVTYFLQLGTIACRLLELSDTEALKQRWIPSIASGESIAAFALTEPSVGSDAVRLSCSARREGDEWVVRGEKASITFAGSADLCIVFCRTGGAGASGVSMVAVPLDLAGVTRQVYKSSTSHLTQRGSLFFDDVRVPLDHQLGAEGAGFVAAMQAFDFNRAVIALACVGAAAQSLDETMAYVKGREAFGRALARHEGVAFQVAEHLAAVHAARLVAYEALALADEGRPHIAQAAMAKWLGPKSAAEATHAAVLLHGWSGFGDDLPLVQRLNDVMGLEVGDGTPEIMKGVIAREAMGRAYTAYR